MSMTPEGMLSCADVALLRDVSEEMLREHVAVHGTDVADLPAIWVRRGLRLRNREAERLGRPPELHKMLAVLRAARERDGDA